MLRNLLLIGLLLSSCRSSTEAPAQDAPPAPPAPRAAPTAAEPPAKAPNAAALQECIKAETEYAALHGKGRDGRPLMGPEDAQSYALERCGMQPRALRGGVDPPHEGPPTPFVPAADNLGVSHSDRPMPTRP